ncbi:NAD(P)H-binding protein [Gordonia sinesedis]
MTTHSTQFPTASADAITGPILVVGANGKTGHRVAQRLADRGVDVRAASRSSQWRFDWTDRSTWWPAIDGAHAAYVTYQPDLIVPGAVEDITEFVRLAERAGLKRVVLLAGRGEAEADEAGRVVHAGDVESTVLSCSWFDQNFDEGEFAAELAEGSLTLPSAEVGEPFIDTDDIADVAVAALLESEPADAVNPAASNPVASNPVASNPTASNPAAALVNPHAGTTYELTGPRLLTFADAVAEIGAAQGREIAFTQVSPEKYRAIMGEVGVPGEVIDLVLTLFATVFDGRNASVTDDVQRVLGRPARDFTDYAASVAAGTRSVTR